MVPAESYYGDNPHNPKGEGTSSIDCTLDFRIFEAGVHRYMRYKGSYAFPSKKIKNDDHIPTSWEAFYSTACESTIVYISDIDKYDIIKFIIEICEDNEWIQSEDFKEAHGGESLVIAIDFSSEIVV